MTQLIKTIRLVFLAAGLATITTLAEPLAAASAAPSCGDPNVCCGNIDDFACGVLVVNAIGHCCGSSNGIATCSAGVFWVYCDSPTGYYCNCNSTGDNCHGPA